MVLPSVYTHVMYSCNISLRNNFNLNIALNNNNRFKLPPIQSAVDTFTHVIRGDPTRLPILSTNSQAP